MKRLLCALLLLLVFGNALSETLNVCVYDREDMPADYGTPEDNEWTRYLRENCMHNLGIKVEYTAVSRKNDRKVLDALINGNRTPDIMFVYDRDAWLEYCNSGLLADLTEVMELYGEGIRESDACVPEYGQINGRLYALCARRGLTDVTSGFIRLDWLEKIGFTAEADEDGYLRITTDELYSILNAFRENGLCRADGAAFLSYGSTEWPVLLILEAFYDQDSISEEELYALPTFLYDGAKDGYRYLNRLYNDGLMNADFAFIGDSDKTGYSADISSGKIGFWVNDSWFGFFDDTLRRLFDSEPGAKVAAVDIVQPGKTASYKYAYSDCGMYIFVPAGSTHADEAVKYLSLLTDAEVTGALTYGFKGEHYNPDEDGIPVPIDMDYNRRTRIDTGDLALLTNRKLTKDNLDAELGIQMLPEKFKELRRASYAVAMKNTFTIPFTDRYQPVDKDLLTRLDEMTRALRFKTVMCAPEEFDRVWDECVTDYLSCGGADLIESKRAQFREYQSRNEE